ncbi:MAG: hypothetical protein ABI378_06210 [Chitinophagaceae bacterium]
MIYEVDIFNSKGERLLPNSTDLKLISVSKTSTDPFLKVVGRLTKKAAAVPPSLEEITKEVEKVRAIRYASKSKMAIKGFKLCTDIDIIS